MTCLTCALTHREQKHAGLQQQEKTKGKAERAVYPDEPQILLFLASLIESHCKHAVNLTVRYLQRS